ncbi:MAG: ATP-binding protein [Thermodesulfobacteriota bacterium]
MAVDRQRYYQGIKQTIFFLIILVSFTPLLGMMAVMGYEFHTAYREKTLAYLEQLVEKQAQGIDSFLEEKLADIQVLAAVLSYRELSSDAGLQKVLQTLQEQHTGVFVDLGLVDSDGLQEAYAGSFKLGRANYAQAPWFIQASRQPAFISDVFLGLRGLPHFIVAVRGRSENRTWLLRSTIDFVAFNLLVEKIRMGSTGRAFIINREGEFQTQALDDLSDAVPLILNTMWPGSTKSGSPDVEGSRNLVAMRDGQRPRQAAVVRTFTGSDPARGEKVIYVAALLKGGDWALVYQQNEADAFANLYRARNISILVLLLGGVAILAMAILLSRRMVRRISSGDQEKEMMNEKVIEAGKLASLGELAAGIAHEINNPVAIMVEESGWIGDLLEESEFADSENVREIKRALSQIRTQGKRCKQITHKLLSFARKTDPVEKHLDVNALITEVIELSEQHARFSNVKFNLDLAPGLPAVLASPSEMQQVVLNLINNAIDAIDQKEGGVVGLTTRIEGNEVVVDISDTGSGIPEANLKRVFDPFFTTKPVGKGTGLGLSIVYGIIKKLNGRITVQSAVGVGTTFHLHLPATGGERKVPENGAGTETGL